MFYSLIHSEQWIIFFFSSDNDLKNFLTLGNFKTVSRVFVPLETK